MASRPSYIRGQGRGRGQNSPNSGDDSKYIDATFKQSVGAKGKNSNSSNSRPGRPGGDRTIEKANSDPDRSPTQNAKQKFLQASSQHNAMVQKHLDKAGQEASDSEEDDISDKVLDDIFKSYIVPQSLEYDGDKVDDVTKVQDDLLHNFRSSTSACLICIESIKKEAAIWSCRSCYCMFHISCIQKWVREGVNLQVYKSEENVSPDSLPWHCPKCRYEYTQPDCPTRYFCFCGKKVNPTFDAWLVAHSCGEICGRRLKNDCGHQCRLLCHPGPCPPCPQTVKAKCFCGKQPPQPRRCSTRAWSCGNACGKLLSCSQHHCPLPCHDGECQPCAKTSKQACRCGKDKAKRPCADTQWQCDQVCGKVLFCGHHLCEVICHEGKCGPCPRSGVRRCPCNKTQYELPCTEEVPTCVDTCGKTLACGQHACERKCHFGDCGQCRELIRKRCRCGQKIKEVLCSKEFLCDSKCTCLRDCGNHQCKRKCCDGVNCPPCEQPCNKPLRCKNHKCSSRCHRGSCYSCPLTVDIFCFCRKTKINVPCGKEKSTRPPRCNQHCKNPPICHHSMQLPHRCHFGSCPPCTQTCNMALDNCDHVCPLVCHSAIKQTHTEVVSQRGPWEKKTEQRVQVVKLPCDPCIVNVLVSCYGKHEEKEVKCFKRNSYICGRACGRTLACTHHTCTLECHDITGSPDTTMAGSSCMQCEEPCGLPRPGSCTHPCAITCHPGACKPCKQLIKLRCHCGSIVKHIRCHEWTGATNDQRSVMQSCGGICHKNLPCGHTCSATCHIGSCPRTDTCEKRITLRCPCRRRKRDFICHVATETNAAVTCDDICEQQKSQKKEAEDKAIRDKEASELAKRLAELEDFERRTQSSRRPKRLRKQHAPPPKPSIFKTHRNSIIISTSLVLFVLFMIYLFYDEF